MKPVKDILRSPRFMREVYVLLFVFAAFNLLVGALLLWSAGNEPEALATAIGGLVAAAVYVVLGLLVRGGSVKALWVVGVLFVLDTVFLLLQPGSKAGLIGRGILVFVLVSFIRRQQKSE